MLRLSHRGWQCGGVVHRTSVFSDDHWHRRFPQPSILPGYVDIPRGDHCYSGCTDTHNWWFDPGLRILKSGQHLCPAQFGQEVNGDFSASGMKVNDQGQTINFFYPGHRSQYSCHTSDRLLTYVHTGYVCECVYYQNKLSPLDRSNLQLLQTRFLPTSAQCKYLFEPCSRIICDTTFLIPTSHWHMYFSLV